MKKEKNSAPALTLTKGESNQSETTASMTASINKLNDPVCEAQNIKRKKY